MRIHLQYTIEFHTSKLYTCILPVNTSIRLNVPSNTHAPRAGVLLLVYVLLVLLLVVVFVGDRGGIAVAADEEEEEECMLIGVIHPPLNCVLAPVLAPVDSKLSIPGVTGGWTDDSAVAVVVLIS